VCAILSLKSSRSLSHLLMSSCLHPTGFPFCSYPKLCWFLKTRPLRESTAVSVWARCNTSCPTNKSVLVFRLIVTLPLAAYVSQAGFSLLQCIAELAMIATPGFPCITSPHLLLLQDINHAQQTDQQLFCAWRQTDGC